MDPALLALLTQILGEDHEMVQRLADAEPVEDIVYEGATDEERAAIGSLANVTDEDLSAIYAAMRDIVRDESNDTDTVIAAKEFGLGVKYVQDVRAEAATVDAETRADALAALGDDDDEIPAELEGMTAEEITALHDATAEPEPEPVVEPEGAPETVAASRPRIGQVAPRVPRPSRPLPSTVDQIEANADRIALRIVDTLGGQFERGQIATDEVLHQALAQAWRTTKGSNESRSYTVASASWLDEYPDDQTLGGDLETNQRIIRAGVGHLQSETPEALTAAICAPPTPLYDIPTLGTEDRPVKAFLPSYGATRGGIIFRPGLSLSTAGTLNATSSGITTNWVDGDENKYVRAIGCPDTETATVEAFVARAEVSNMQGQFDPESIAAALRLQMVLWARGTETNLLDKIDAASSQILNDNTAVIGFGRLLLERYNNAATLIRSQERMARDATLDLLLPFWVINAFMDDLSFQAPGDGLATLTQTAGDIERYLAARNIRVGWFLDDQLMPTQAFTPPMDLAGYPQSVEGYIFEPGHHLFLDGGELNLGIVRDSTLNNTNEYQTFMETFEGHAARGVVSWALSFNVCRSGTTGAPAEITCGEIS